MWPVAWTLLRRDADTRWAAQAGHGPGWCWARNGRRISARSRGVSDPPETRGEPCFAPGRGVAHAPTPFLRVSSPGVGAAKDAAPIGIVVRPYLPDATRFLPPVARDRGGPVALQSTPRCSAQRGADTLLAS